MIDVSIEKILRGAKLRTMVPTNQFKLTDAEYIQLANDDFITRLVPTILSVRENFFLRKYNFTVQTISVEGFGQDNFGLFPFGSPTPIETEDLLSRAIGTTIKDIWYVDTNGNPLGRVNQLSNADIISLDGYAGFSFEGSKIVLFPIQVFNNKNIQVQLYRQPNNLTLSSNCAKVIFNNTVEERIQVDQVPANWVIGTKIDIIRGKQAYDSILDSVTIGGIDGTVLYLSETSEKISTGDIVAPECYAPVPQIPINCVPLLEQLLAIKILESMKDSAGLKNAYDQYTLLEKQCLGVISNRAKSNLKNFIGRGLWR